MSIFEQAVKPAHPTKSVTVGKPHPLPGVRNSLSYSILDLQRKVGNRAVQRILARTSTPAIQRTATWDEGKVHEINNLASVIIKNKVEADGRGAVGYTYPMLNGKLLPPGNSVDAQKAINTPEIVDTVDASGQHNVQVKTVLENKGSYDENVLKPPPWTTTASKNAVQAIFPSLTDCSGKGDTTFRALGDPDDKAMYEANRRHEDHHVNDYKSVFENTVVPWDKKLTAAQSAGTKFSGKSQDEAVDALYTAMGGKSYPIAKQYKEGAYASGAKFHKEPKGGPPSPPKDIKADRDCSNASAAYFNPG